MLSSLLILLSIAPGTEGLTTARPQCAQMLADALDRATEVRRAGGTGLPGLIEVSREVSLELAGSRAGAALEASAWSAEWNALSDSEAAYELLVRRVSTLQQDLAFSPRIEAPMPEGFPAPTPVGEIEVKEYPLYRMARTSMSGTAFWRLFNHIKSNEIAMTAPVEMTWAEGDAGMREVDMAFLYGSTELGPEGEQGKVEVVDATPMTVLSLGCRGEATRTAVQRGWRELQAWLALHPEYEAVGPMRGMAYNSPMVPSRRKYFEVQVPIDRVGRTAPILSPAEDEESERWRSVDDRVMGGVSQSQALQGDEGLIFSGDLSLENNGGFASIRRPLPEGLPADATHVRLRIKGDGRTYKLRARTDRAFDGVSYEHPFETTVGEWVTLDLALSDFRPVWRGRVLPDRPALAPTAIQQLGLMVSDKQEGAFSLELSSLDAVLAEG